MLRTIISIALLATMLQKNAVAASRDACESRASFVGAIAIERDKGTKKEQTVKLVRSRLPANADTSSLQAYIDLVYSQPSINPDSFKALSFKQCMNSAR
jgi:hypothetical protein